MEMQTEQRASCAFGRREQGKAVRIRRNSHCRVRPLGFESDNLPFSVNAFVRAEEQGTLRTGSVCPLS